MTNQNETNASPDTARYVLIVLLTFAAFLGMYKFAEAKNAQAAGTGVAAIAGAPTGAGAASAGGSCCGGGAAGGAAGSAGAAGGSCCGGSGASAASVPGTTKVQGGVQTVSIDLTTGSYSPNQITAKAGIPIVLDFKGPASGCNGFVQSQQLGFQQDVSNGGTIKVRALQPGTYQWTCGMGMYIGRITVQ